ncbi:MAG: hypothetical protein JWO94_3853 [Verrucomicrobiaceae bacterium]|nr:hypothetical protein [Verrucomicrobiaceae bacterium]
MTTSTPANTSKSDGACRCNKDCGCCVRKELAATALRPPAAEPGPPPGFLARRPWIWVFVAFGIMFSAWTVMFTLAMKNQPANVELTQGSGGASVNN